MTRNGMHTWGLMTGHLGEHDDCKFAVGVCLRDCVL